MTTELSATSIGQQAACESAESTEPHAAPPQPPQSARSKLTSNGAAGQRPAAQIGPVAAMPTQRIGSESPIAVGAKEERGASAPSRDALISSSRLDSDDYVFTVGEDGSTIVKPSGKCRAADESGNSPRLGVRDRVHTGGVLKVVELPRLGKPTTPQIHPWEDRAHAESDLMALLDKESSRNELLERSGLDHGSLDHSFKSTMTITGIGRAGSAADRGASRRGESNVTSRTGTAQSRKENREAWKARGWNEWQERQQSGKDRSFSEALAFRAKARCSHSREIASRLCTGGTTKPPTPRSVLMGKAERKIILPGALSRDGMNRVDWELLDEGRRSCDSTASSMDSDERKELARQQLSQTAAVIDSGMSDIIGCRRTQSSELRLALKSAGLVAISMSKSPGPSVSRERERALGRDRRKFEPTVISRHQMEDHTSAYFEETFGKISPRSPVRKHSAENQPAVRGDMTYRGGSKYGLHILPAHQNHQVSKQYGQNLLLDLGLEEKRSIPSGSMPVEIEPQVPAAPKLQMHSWLKEDQVSIARRGEENATNVEVLKGRLLTPGWEQLEERPESMHGSPDDDFKGEIKGDRHPGSPRSRQNRAKNGQINSYITPEESMTSIHSGISAALNEGYDFAVFETLTEFNTAECLAGSVEGQECLDKIFADNNKIMLPPDMTNRIQSLSSNANQDCCDHGHDQTILPDFTKDVAGTSKQSREIERTLAENVRTFDKYSNQSSTPTVPPLPLPPSSSDGRAVGFNSFTPESKIFLTAAGFNGLEHAALALHKTKNAKLSSPRDDAILSNAHFMLEYTAESNVARLEHVAEVKTTSLWSGDYNEIEALGQSLEDILALKQFEGMVHAHYRRIEKDSAHSNRLPSSCPPNTSLSKWLVEADKNFGSGGDIRSFHFLPPGVLRDFIEAKKQLFASHGAGSSHYAAKKRSNGGTRAAQVSAFKDGRLALLSGKVTNLEYVKGLVVRCPADKKVNAASVSMGVPGGHLLAPDVIMDLVFGHGAWSKEKEAKRARTQAAESFETKLALKREKAGCPTYAHGQTPTIGQNEIVAEGPCHEVDHAANSERQAPTTGAAKTMINLANLSRPTTGSKMLMQELFEQKLRGVADEGMRQRTPLSVHPLPLKEIPLDSVIGLPRHMRPRPLKFEADSEFLAYAQVAETGNNERMELRRSSSFNSACGKSSGKITRVPSTHVLPIHDGNEDEEVEPMPPPPRTAASGVSSFMSRRVSRESSRQSRRVSRLDHEHVIPSQEGPPLPKPMPASEHVQDHARLGLMDLFFPSVNESHPNNRDLPSENDRLGFVGNTRAAKEQSANESSPKPPRTPGEMGSLPADLFDSLRDRREIDAAVRANVAVAPMVNRFSGNAIKNPLTLATKQQEIKNKRLATKSRKESLKLEREQATPGYITDRRFRRPAQVLNLYSL